MQMQQINIFVLVLSILFLSGKIFDLTIRLFETDPKPIKFSDIEKILIHFSFSYIITNLII